MKPNGKEADMTNPRNDHPCGYFNGSENCYVCEYRDTSEYERLAAKRNEIEDRLIEAKVRVDTLEVERLEVHRAIGRLIGLGEDPDA